MIGDGRTRRRRSHVLPELSGRPPGRRSPRARYQNRKSRAYIRSDIERGPRKFALLAGDVARVSRHVVDGVPVRNDLPRSAHDLELQVEVARGDSGSQYVRYARLEAGVRSDEVAVASEGGARVAGDRRDEDRHVVPSHLDEAEVGARVDRRVRL